MRRLLTRAGHALAVMALLATAVSSLTSLFANQPANRRTEAQVVIVGKTSKELVVRFLEPEMHLLHRGSKGSRLRQCLGDSVVEERQQDGMGAGSWLPRPR